jgi:uncharacterized protein (TIGR01244 family)
MQTRSYLIFMLATACLAANAGETNSDAATRIHADIDEVVASAAVTPVDGITSAGQPDAAALRVFADSGYAAVIDMRGPDEDRGLDDEQASVEALGMDYIALPVTSADEISFETAGKLDDLLQSIEGPVLVHCGSGNRVGAVLALRHSLSGASAEEAIAFGKNSGLTRLESVVRKRLSETSQN